MVLLGKEVQVVVLAVVADLFDHRPNAGFPLRNQFGVLQLLALEIRRDSFLLGKGTFKFGDPGSCSRNISN